MQIIHASDAIVSVSVNMCLCIWYSKGKKDSIPVDNDNRWSLQLWTKTFGCIQSSSFQYCQKRKKSDLPPRFLFATHILSICCRCVFSTWIVKIKKFTILPPKSIYFSFLYFCLGVFFLFKSSFRTGHSFFIVAHFDWCFFLYILRIKFVAVHRILRNKQSAQLFI